MSLERGIILGNSFGNGFIKDDISVELVFQCLLFWDKIDYTNVMDISYNGGPSQCLCPELDFLQSIGIAQKNEKPNYEEKVLISGKMAWDISEIFLVEQYATLLKNSRDKNIIWSTINDVKNNNTKINSDDVRACIEIELYNSIPIPSKAIPIDDVLKFKAKRKDELLALRHYLDELTLEISSTENFEKRKLITLDRLNKQINDYQKVFKETKFKYIWRSLSTIATDPLIALSGLIGVAGSIALPMATPVFTKLTGSAIGASTIKYTYKEIFTPNKLPKELNHLSYLSKMNNELWFQYNKTLERISNPAGDLFAQVNR